jgi:hypothetical protein
VAAWWSASPAPGAAARLGEAFGLAARIFGELLPALARPR